MQFLEFANNPLGINLAIFAAAAAGVWFSGSYLSRFADIIAERTGMGRAFAGVLLLGTATSLPEIATTATAASGGNATLAGMNLIGGVAMQLAVLAAVDACMMRGQALTFFSPQPALLMQGVMLVLLISLAMAAISVEGPNSAVGGTLLGIGYWSWLLAAAYVLALWTMYRYEGHSRWEPTGEVGQPPQSAVDLKDAQLGKYQHATMSRIALQFAACCSGVLVAGWLVATTGEAIAKQSGLGSSFVGATLIALATSLPEVSTTVSAVRFGAYSMAVGNIFGTNALEVALFPFADAFYRDGTLFAALDSSAVFLAALGAVMTCVYLWGVLERRDRTVLGMGLDSAAALLIYVAGMTVYYFIRPQ